MPCVAGFMAPKRVSRSNQPTRRSIGSPKCRLSCNIAAAASFKANFSMKYISKHGISDTAQQSPTSMYRKTLFNLMISRQA
jgi:hypothetical protein